MKQNVIIGLDRAAPCWDDLFSSFYAQSRQEILPGELDFWRSLCRPGDRVLEVGAGTGFISRAYAAIPQLKLTLIEPEAANVACLKKIAVEPSTTLEVFLGIFQHFPPPGQFDLVMTSWDNLVMFDEKSKGELFAFAAGALRPGGCFATHLSSEDWNRKVFLKLKEPKIFNMEIDQEEFQVTYIIEEVEENFYHKTIILRSLVRNIEKSYLLPTRIESLEKTLARAAAAGLRLSKKTSDFLGNDVSDPEDHVLVFERPG